MKNVTQTIKFPALAICSTQSPTELTKAIAELHLARAKKEEVDEAEIKAAEEKVRANTPEQLRAELDAMQVALPGDMIDLTMSVGSLIFDTYMHVVKPPQAPLARHLYQKRCQDLAELLDKDEFELPDYAKGAVKQCLSSEPIWAQLNASVWSEIDSKDGKVKRFTPINSKGVNYFNEVVNALTGVFIEEEEQKQEKADQAPKASAAPVSIEQQPSAQ